MVKSPCDVINKLRRRKEAKTKHLRSSRIRVCVDHVTTHARLASLQVPCTIPKERDSVALRQLCSGHGIRSRDSVTR